MVCASSKASTEEHRIAHRYSSRPLAVRRPADNAAAAGTIVLEAGSVAAIGRRSTAGTQQSTVMRERKCRAKPIRWSALKADV